MTVLVVGEALVDIVRGAGGDVVHPGGSPYNVAVGLGRLGVPVVLAAQIGDDVHGAALREHLAASGAGLVELEPVARTSSAVVTLGEDGGAAYDFDLTWAPDALPDPTGFEAVHVGSIGAWLEPGAELVVALARRASAGGVVVTYDANVRPTIEPDAQAWRQAAGRVVPAASVVKMSDEDAELLFPGRRPAAVVRELAEPGRLVVVTRGGEGAVLGAGDDIVTVSAPSVDVADTIGAGDSFMAATIAWLASRSWPLDGLGVAGLEELGTYATRLAAVTVSRPGADPPWPSDLPPR